MRVLEPAIGLYRRAQLEFSSRRIPECLRLLRQAELRGHDPDECASCRWNCWMLLGRLEEAWRESDSIAARATYDPNRLWDGLPFARKRVVIRCLHGYGDAIQFVRYAPLVRAQAASVTVQTHPQLVSLFRGIESVDRVTTWSDGPGRRGADWDQQIEVMELPRAFRTTLATVPAEIPYLRVQPQYRVGRFGGRCKPRVGLLWEGGDWNPVRNVPLEELRPVLKTPGVQFYSFQRGPGREKLASLSSARDIADLSGDSPDVVHFAADLLEMDLLLTVDTMAAHLAGALGIAVWLLLPFEADWRWMLDRCDSPWYPTMRLFRQQAPGAWRAPVQQAARELRVLRHTGWARTA